MKKRRIVVLGSTGSIGESTLRVARSLPDQIEIIGLAAATSSEKLAEQAAETGARHLGIYDESQEGKLRSLAPSGSEISAGPESLIALATLEEADIVLISIVGTAGLQPALAAIRAGKDLAIASKEILVMAGEIITREAEKAGVKILPVDSEHNAIFQCLEGHRGSEKEISKIILTASGGPFRNTPAEELASVTLEMALNHPTWDMGPKISIDSATLFNKGLEMIEARWLFGITMDKIEAIIHPQSIVHSMVEFTDGSILAQLSQTDMAFPIQYALTYPERLEGNLKKLDLAQLAELSFSTPRTEDFPALLLARDAGLTGGTMPAVFNAANEVAVDAFRNKRISFPEIWGTVAKVMSAHQIVQSPDLTQILAADADARSLAQNAIGTVI